MSSYNGGYSASLSNIGITVIETGESGERDTSGWQWYRLYSDGWLEQGGIASVPHSQDVTVNFLYPYTTPPMVLVAPTRSQSSTISIWKVCVATLNRTTTSVTIDDHDIANQNYSSIQGVWFAQGWAN